MDPRLPQDPSVPDQPVRLVRTGAVVAQFGRFRIREIDRYRNGHLMPSLNYGVFLVTESGDETKLGNILRRNADLVGLLDFINRWRCRYEGFIRRVQDLIRVAPTQQQLEGHLEMESRIAHRYQVVKEAHAELVRMRSVRGLPEDLP